MENEPHIDALWEDHDMGTRKDLPEVSRDPKAWEPIEETGLQTPEEKSPHEREDPRHNPFITPLPGDDEQEPDSKKQPTLH